ncbi:unnamed protein product [Phytophthora lilii]|uniref:Unnamed protein product n=1 Tax=Phytophthora lilii TaxID=2077276 RepID=A0A9W6XFY4_9STRA|nr:unnamed protein product [Phytophthora lilii]
MEASQDAAKIASSTQLARFAVYYWSMITLTASTQDTQCIRQYLRECKAQPTDTETTGFRIVDPTERPSINSVVGNEDEESYATPGRDAAIETSPGAIGVRRPRVPRSRSRTSIATTPSAPQTPNRPSAHPRTPTLQTPLRRSARRKTPTPQALEVELNQVNEEDALNDIGDDVDGVEIFPHWEEYLDEVFGDDELEREFADSNCDDSNTSNSTSTTSFVTNLASSSNSVFTTNEAPAATSNSTSTTAFVTNLVSFSNPAFTTNEASAGNSARDQLPTLPCCFRVRTKALQTYLNGVEVER